MTENWQQAVKNKNREELLSAGKSLFMSQSFLSVSINDVCRAAGVSRVTFYKHFSSIDDMILEIQMEILQEMTQFIQRDVTAGMNGRQKLASILHVWLEYSKQYPAHIKFILLFDLHFESYSSNHDIKKRYADFVQKNMEQHFLYDALASGARDGSLKADTVPAVTAPFIFTSMMGLLQKLSINEDASSHNGMTQQFADMIVQHLSS